MWKAVLMLITVHGSVHLYGGLTFSRIDINSWSVEHLLILPVSVPQNSFDAKQKNQGGAAVDQHRPGGLASLSDVQRPHAHRYQQAKAHTGDVQYPLCYHKPDVEKQICGGEERDRQQAKGEHHNIFRGG